MDKRERMLQRLPRVFSVIEDFQAIMGIEGLEFETSDKSAMDVLSDAYLSTMGEERIKEWERILKINPIPGSTLSDRRETIQARLYNNDKLNTDSISHIVGIFTGGTAKSWFQDSTLYVEILPPPENKSYQFANVEQELLQRIPSHINFQVTRRYYTWQDLYDDNPSWQSVRDNYANWEDVLLSV